MLLETGRSTTPTPYRASRERVLSAAAHLFRQRGYASTTMRDVAEHANMRAGSIYYYYPSKQQMLNAVLDRAITTLTERTAPLLTGQRGSLSCRERFARAIHAHIMVTVEMGDFSLAFRRLVGELEDNQQREIATKRNLLDEHWRRLLSEAASGGELSAGADLAIIRLLVIGAINSTHEWFNPAKGSSDAVVDTLTRMVFEGFSPER